MDPYRSGQANRFAAWMNPLFAPLPPQGWALLQLTTQQITEEFFTRSPLLALVLLDVWLVTYLFLLRRPQAAH